MELRRGDIVLTDFSPARQHEADFVRPAVLVTNDQANRYGNAVAVVPLTSNVEDVYAFQLFLSRTRTGLDRDSKAQVELLRSVSKSRLRRNLGAVPADLMAQLDSLLAEHLALPRPASR